MIKCQAHLGVPNISSHLISYLISLKTLGMEKSFSSSMNLVLCIKLTTMFEMIASRLSEDSNKIAKTAVQCIIAAGIFNIVYLDPTNSGVPPFNVADVIKCPYFTVDETRELFCEFAQDLSYLIDDAIVEDVWAKSNGSVAQLD